MSSPLPRTCAKHPTMDAGCADCQREIEDAMRCLCRVIGPDYDQTRISRACPFHGDNGSMVATIRLRAPR